MPREHITTEHTPESWRQEFAKYAKGENVDIYARSGYPELRKREKEFADMIGVPDTALMNAGMAAMVTAVEAENLRPGDVVLCGKDVYSQTKKMYESLEKRGIVVERLDSGDMDSIAQLVQEKNPRLIILEDIANAKEMQVCDLKKLSHITREANERYTRELGTETLLNRYLAAKSEGDKVRNETKGEILAAIREFQDGRNPFIFRKVVRLMEKDLGQGRVDVIRELSRIVKSVMNNARGKLSLIIDNTLASPMLYNPLKDIGSDVEAVVVESGTKHYQKGRDRITLGICYARDQEKIRKIKEKRTELGTYLQPRTEREIPKDITTAMPKILKRHAENALNLAGALHAGGVVGITVHHPNLPSHAQHELVQTIAPEGLVTLFYLTVSNAEEFVQRVKKIGGDIIGVGGSFGHKKTWLMYIGEDTVRIATGSESKKDFQEVLRIFEEVLQSYKTNA